MAYPQSTSTPPPPTASLQPTLTPKFCFNTTALQDFLRLSRATVDDPLSVHLNALLHGSTFNPLSTSTRLASSSSRRQIPASTCATFKQHILFPSWKVRSDVIAYCNQVADAPNPNEVPILPGPGSITAAALDDASPSSRSYGGKEQVVDDRLDPYSANSRRESPSDNLKQILRNEEVVERIVRTRTWGMLGERCIAGGAGGGEGWEDEWNQWNQDGRRHN